MADIWHRNLGHGYYQRKRNYDAFRSFYFSYEMVVWEEVIIYTIFLILCQKELCLFFQT